MFVNVLGTRSRIARSHRCFRILLSLFGGPPYLLVLSEDVCHVTDGNVVNDVGQSTVGRIWSNGAICRH